MDQFANTLYLQALGGTREGIVDPSVQDGYAAVTNGPVGHAAHLWRWDPWVRAMLFQQELAGPHILFEPAGTTGLRMLVGGRHVLTLHRPTDTQFRAQIADVLSYASLRQDRGAEVLTQIDGQWPFWATILPLPVAELPKTQAVLAAVTQFAVVIELQFKHHLACRRPVEWSAQVQPMITTPGHGTFPMGHGTQVYAVVAVLQALLVAAWGSVPASLLAALKQLAFRVAENRIVAGVHFPVDLAGGAVLGDLLGRLAISRMTGSPIAVLDDPVFVQTDWQRGPLNDMAGCRPGEALAGRMDAADPLPTIAAPLLVALWTAAVAELKAVLVPPTA